MKTSLLKNGVTFALAQMSVIPGNPRANAEWIIAEILSAASRGIDIIAFPEQAVPGYLLGDMPEDESYVRDVWRENRRIIDATIGLDIVAIFGSYAIDRDDAKGEDGRVRKLNAGFVVQNGVALAPVRLGRPRFFTKTLMPKYRMFDDERHFMSLPKLAESRGESFYDLIGRFTVRIRGQHVRLGCMICEDMWDGDYTLKPSRMLAKLGVDLLVNISCSPWGWQKNRKRHETVKELSKYTQVPFIYVNNVGVQNNGKNYVVFDGSSTVYNESGDVAAYLEPYFEGVRDVTVKLGMPSVEYREADDVTQLYRGIKYGVRGYLRTIPVSMHRVVLGLSGGVDSAVNAALMVDILGKENVIGINMPYGDYNSASTIENARETARLLGIEYHEIPIDALVNTQAELHGIRPGTGPFKTIMSTARMTVISARASAVHAFFTSNGNKPEIAFGFFTNNGDGRGAIAPLGDLLKGEVYQLAHHLNTVVFGREVIPRAVMDIDPMDELGPQGGIRKDPFDYGRVLPDGTLIRGYHDAMVHAIVGFRKNPEWFLERYMSGDLERDLLLPEGKIALLFSTPEKFIEDLERCWALFWGGIWKRVQSVPNVLTSKRAFGFDLREAVMEAPYYTARYYELKSQILTQAREIVDA